MNKLTYAEDKVFYWETEHNSNEKVEFFLSDENLDHLQTCTIEELKEDYLCRLEDILQTKQNKDDL